MQQRKTKSKYKKEDYGRCSVFVTCFHLLLGNVVRLFTTPLYRLSSCFASHRKGITSFCHYRDLIFRLETDFQRLVNRYIPFNVKRWLIFQRLMVTSFHFRRVFGLHGAAAKMPARRQTTALWPRLRTPCTDTLSQISPLP